MTTATESILKEILASSTPAYFEDGKEARKKAFDQLSEIGLPTSKSEEYRFTPITKVLEKKFTWTGSYPASSAVSVDFYLPTIGDTHLIVFTNGRFAKHLSQLEGLEANVVVSTFEEADSKTRSVIQSLLGTMSKTEDAFAAMNGAFYQEGIFVHVPANTQVAKPILVLHINDAQEKQVIAHTRLLVSIEKGSSLSIIEKSDSLGTQPCFRTFTEEMIVAENATLDYCKIQNDSGAVHQVSNTFIAQADSSRVNTFTLTLNGQIIRNNLTIQINGEQCESHFNGLYLVNGNTLVDNHTVVDHQKPNSFSNEMYKGIMDDQSKGVFNGKIYVRPHAQKTNAFQSNRNILMSENATINTKPQLEIWADDVKCSHGCTTGQLDEEALFYLQARGIPYASAKAMLLYAFALDVLTVVKNEKLKAYLDQLISERLHKNF
ncbi:MAG: Fe-S cluster assembly protein SufD [Cyclobacteriaceae bacterium]|nr:Fe-S cluster assembly protein SufD [Cyclobacteriaceae bacterium]